MSNNLKTFVAILSVLLIFILIACGSNGIGTKEDTSASTDHTDNNTEHSPINNTDCVIKAKLGARDWTAHSVIVNRIDEHLTISTSGDGNEQEIHSLQIMIHNFTGPGTYTYKGDGVVTFSVGLTQTDSYVTTGKDDHGTITITEYAPDKFKASFNFKASDSDTMGQPIEVTGGEVSIEKGACTIQEIINKK
ncbi:hypothetical protein HHL16_24625 [Pseudoflavitalea sp. G-6-1-2]|uniref:DUF6252 family protein n=1 Tax=Pseudoflavitalea sp. G-6-1-2 TaxID=2728841 RepID=UPI00146AEB7A|nr:DUF6252 family protein [Pseudoflavitalea sp. G-6-1-2]NML24086.1 hypothetical protein [Pseudoflavitalea sp. G-6-1-2]